MGQVVGTGVPDTEVLVGAVVPVDDGATVPVGSVVPVGTVVLDGATVLVGAVVLVGGTVVLVGTAVLVGGSTVGVQPPTTVIVPVMDGWNEQM
jgi:hypothetical protein